MRAQQKEITSRDKEKKRKMKDRKKNKKMSRKKRGSHRRSASHRPILLCRLFFTSEGRLGLRVAPGAAARVRVACSLYFFLLFFCFCCRRSSGGVAVRARRIDGFLFFFGQRRVHAARCGPSSVGAPPRRAASRPHVEKDVPRAHEPRRSHGGTGARASRLLWPCRRWHRGTDHRARADHV